MEFQSGGGKLPNEILMSKAHFQLQAIRALNERLWSPKNSTVNPL
jgi:hypothetical protein